MLCSMNSVKSNRYELILGSQVLVAQTYKELCLAAKNEKKMLLEFMKH